MGERIMNRLAQNLQNPKLLAIAGSSGMHTLVFECDDAIIAYSQSELEYFLLSRNGSLKEATAAMARFVEGDLDIYIPPRLKARFS
jgi:hypothetical protein